MCDEAVQRDLEREQRRRENERALSRVLRKGSPRFLQSKEDSWSSYRQGIFFDSTEDGGWILRASEREGSSLEILQRKRFREQGRVARCQSLRGRFLKEGWFAAGKLALHWACVGEWICGCGGCRWKGMANCCVQEDGRLADTGGIAEQRS